MLYRCPILIIDILIAPRSTHSFLETRTRPRNMTNLSPISGAETIIRTNRLVGY